MYTLFSVSNKGRSVYVIAFICWNAFIIFKLMDTMIDAKKQDV